MLHFCFDPEPFWDGKRAQRFSANASDFEDLSTFLFTNLTPLLTGGGNVFFYLINNRGTRGETTGVSGEC